jgi:pyruvate/2-oxoglutarate dehydrogenase complex dihydrolipoamide dehydrogenase (E3) component
LARTLGINIKEWVNVVHGHPTLSEVIQEAARIFCGAGIHSI